MQSRMLVTREPGMKTAAIGKAAGCAIGDADAPDKGTGRVSLSTLHSSKGREFDAVILYGMNVGDIPSWHDEKSAGALREARRLFYVGVTRPRKELSVVYRDGAPSPWLIELYKRSKQA